MEGLEWQRLGCLARNTHAIAGRRLFAGDRHWARRRHKLRNIGALGQFDPELLPKPVRRIILLQFRTQARRFNPDDRVRLGGVVRTAISYSLICSGSPARTFSTTNRRNPLWRGLRTKRGLANARSKCCRAPGGMTCFLLLFGWNIPFRQLNYTTAVIRGDHRSILRRALKINAFGTRYGSASYRN